jgi:hypothetical protein
MTKAQKKRALHCLSLALAVAVDLLSRWQDSEYGRQIAFCLALATSIRTVLLTSPPQMFPEPAKPARKPTPQSEAETPLPPGRK